MSSGHKTVTAFLTLICALLLVIIGLCLHWPRWAWPALASVLLAGATVTVVVTRRQRASIPREFLPDPDLPIPPVERWERTVSGVALPSAVEDYDFLFSATVRWRPVEGPSGTAHINAGGLAVDAVLTRAQEITAQQFPYRSTLAQHQLDGALGMMRLDASGLVEAMAENVTLQLSDADQDRLTKLSTVRKNEDVWEHERNYERSKRTYLGNEVLKDTGSAVVWWMAKHDDRVEKTVDLIGPLAQLSSAANNRAIPELFRHLVPQPDNTAAEPSGTTMNGHPFAYGGPFADSASPNGHPPPHEPAEPGVPEALEFLMSGAGLHDDAVRALFARRVADYLAAMDCADAATAVRERFDSPEPPSGTSPTDEPPAETDRPESGEGQDHREEP